MAVTKAQLEEALRRADAAGNTADATALAVQLDILNRREQEVTTPTADAVLESNALYMREQAKVGIGDFLYRSVKNFSDPLAKIIFSDQVETDKPTWEMSEEEYRDYVQRQRNREAEIPYELAEDILSYQENIQPTGALGEVLGAGARAVTGDPFLSFAGGRGKLGLLIEGLASFAAGAGGAVGGEIGGQIAAELGASEETQRKASQLLATITGLASGATTSSLTRSGAEGVNVWLDARRRQKSIQDTVDEAANFISDSQVKTMIRDAVAAEPNIDATVNSIRALEDAVPGLVIPPASGLADNPIVRQNLTTLLQTNPSFRANYNNAIADAYKAIQNRTNTLFGTDTPSVSQARLAGFKDNYGVSLQNVQKRINSIDTAIGRQLERIRPADDSVSAGEQVRKLLEAKEKSVREKMGLKYDRLISDYKQRGLQFPASAVRDIYQTAKIIKYRDLFTASPTVIRDINKYFAPKEVGVPSIITTKTGKPAPPTKTRVYEPVPLEVLDSLKRAINRELRQTVDPDKARQVRALKDEFQRAVNTMNPEFAARYRAIDEQYYKDLGIPKDSAGVRQLTAARFRDSVGNFISKPEQAADFLNFVGEAGIPVVRDAMLLKLEQAAINPDGSFNARGYAKFLNDRLNTRTMNLIPNFRGQLSDIRRSLDAMVETKNRLQTQYDNESVRLTDNVFKAVFNKGLEAVVTDILSKPAQSHKYLRSIKNYSAETFEMARNAIRKTMVNRMFAQNDSRAFLNSKADTFNEWFGAGYVKNVEALADVQDILNKIDTSRIGYSINIKDTDALEKATGNTAANISSLFRDRISSTGHKVNIFLSRWFTKKTAVSRDDQLARLFLSPESLDSIASVAKAHKAKTMTLTEAKERIAKAINKAIFKQIYLFQAGAESMQDAEQNQ